MSDAMVTARMSSTKKEAGNRVLEKIGTNASQAINDLYDYVLDHGDLPWKKDASYYSADPEAIADAMRWVDGLQVEVSPKAASMSIKDAKRARLNAQGIRK